MTRLEAWRLTFSGLTALATGLVALVAVLSYLKVQEVFSPPSAPRTLTGVVRNGNVDLRWEKPAYLAETVAGYRIEILSNVVDRESGVIRQPPSGPPAQSGSVPPARHR